MDLLKGARPLLLAAALALFFGACDEQLDGGMACPALCPVPPANVRDTTIFAVELDTSISGFPSLGTEIQLFIASMGDTLQTRGVVRYDSLPQSFKHNNSATDSTIVFVDTGAVLKVRLVTGDTIGAPTTVEAYDVDLNGAEESDPSAVGGAFTPDRLLGSRTFAAESLRDSITIPIDPAKLLAKIQQESPANRLRVGLKVSSAGKAQLRVVTSNGASPPLLIFRPSADTTVPLYTLGPNSKTPAQAQIAADMADYLLILQKPPDPPPGVFRVGGLPGQRAYIRFNVPSSIIDSSNVVRATLLLTQRPNGFSPEPRDSVAIQQFAVVASSAINDIARALLFISAARSDSMRVAAADSGTRAFEMINLVRAWRGTTAARTPRALALRTTTEGISGRQVDFFSTEAPLAVRPRLRLTYLPQQQAGLP